MTSSGTDTSPLVRGSRIALVALAFLFGIGAVVQVFLAGLSVFESAESRVDHVDLSRMLGLPALLIPVTALLGRVGRQRMVMAVGVLVLYMLQMVLATVENSYIGAFHPLDAFAVTGMALQAGSRTLGLVRSEERSVRPYGSFRSWVNLPKLL